MKKPAAKDLPENSTCPNCGFCPACGRAYSSAPLWIPAMPPYYPYWTPTYTITSGTDSNTTSALPLYSITNTNTN